MLHVILFSHFIIYSNFSFSLLLFLHSIYTYVICIHETAWSTHMTAVSVSFRNMVWGGQNLTTKNEVEGQQ